MTSSTPTPTTTTLTTTRPRTSRLMTTTAPRPRKRAWPQTTTATWPSPIRTTSSDSPAGSRVLRGTTDLGTGGEVAAPTKTVPHPGRALAALIALIVIMLLAIAGGDLFSPGKWHNDFRIGLGLDLSSGTVLSMKATTLNGGTPSTSDLNEAKTIILSRVNASGNTGAQVQTQGNDILNVSVPGKTSQQTEQLVSETALLNFRQTLLYQPYSATPSTPVPSASPSTSASASPSASASSTATATPSPSTSATSTASTS